MVGQLRVSKNVALLLTVAENEPLERFYGAARQVKRRAAQVPTKFGKIGVSKGTERTGEQ
jgi:hypothetical protein